MNDASRRCAGGRAGARPRSARRGGHSLRAPGARRGRPPRPVRPSGFLPIAHHAPRGAIRGRARARVPLALPGVPSGAARRRAAVVTSTVGGIIHPATSSSPRPPRRHLTVASSSSPEVTPDGILDSAPEGLPLTPPPHAGAPLRRASPRGSRLPHPARRAHRVRPRQRPAVRGDGRRVGPHPGRGGQRPRRLRWTPPPSPTRAIAPSLGAPGPDPDERVPRHGDVRDPAGGVRVRTRVEGLLRGAGFPGPDEEFELARAKLLPHAANGVLLDASCGSGLFSRRFAKSGEHGAVIALDFSDAMLRQARRFARDEGLLGGDDDGPRTPAPPPPPPHVRPRGHRPSSVPVRDDRGGPRGRGDSLLAGSSVGAGGGGAGDDARGVVLRDDAPDPSRAVRGRPGAARDRRGDARGAGRGGRARGARAGSGCGTSSTSRSSAWTAGWWISSATRGAGSSLRREETRRTKNRRTRRTGRRKFRRPRSNVRWVSGQTHVLGLLILYVKRRLTRPRRVLARRLARTSPPTPPRPSPSRAPSRRPRASAESPRC